MLNPVFRSALIPVFMITLFSCSARREARRNALEEIRIMPREELAVHPLVNQIKDFQTQLDELQAVLILEDPEKLLAEANATIRQMHRDMEELEGILESADAELRSLGRHFEKRIIQMEEQP